MPRIPQVTAEGRPAHASVPMASPWHFGAQAFGQLTAFGEQIQKSAETIKARQDELDLTKADDAYRVQLHSVLQGLAATPDTSQHRDLFEKGVAEAQANTRKMYSDLSAPAQQVLEGRFSHHTATAAIAASTQTQKMGVSQVLADYDQLADSRVSRAALSVNSVEAADAMNEVDLHRERNVSSGMMDPVTAQKDAELRRDQYWKILAQHRPGYLLGMEGDGNGIMTMDPARRQEYRNLATNALSQQRLADEQSVKQEQDANARQLTADILEGKPIGNAIPVLMRTGGLDDAVGRTLYELQHKVALGTDLAHYIKGLAGNLEASFRSMKYSVEPLHQGTEMNLAKLYIDGSITKEEMTHLMGVWQGVVDHRSQIGKEGQNRVVTHAHDNLVRSLRTTGPADKFDALSEQTIKEASQFFYQRIEADPQAKPWDVMKEAEGIFKPVIKDRLNMSKVDQSALDDAKMKALLHSKAISPATYKAWNENKQKTIGQGIVDEALRTLPPVQHSGFQEWLKSLKSWWPKPEETK